MIEHYNHFLPKLLNVSGITLGKHVYYRMDSQYISERLRRHEMVHVEQYKKFGFYRFLYLYVKEYFKYRLKGLNHYQAYIEISFEKDARLKETLNG